MTHDIPAPTQWLCRLLQLPDPRRLTEQEVVLSRAEWDQVLPLAIAQQVAPLLYHRAQTDGWAVTAPDDILGQLRTQYLHTAARNRLVVYHGLHEVLIALRQAQIPVIVLKGADLAERVYGNIAVRPMGDVDLLVNMEDVLRVSDCLTYLEYQPSRPFWLEAERTVMHHLPPVTKTGAAPIEVHWQVVSPQALLAINIADIWQRARPATIAGVEVLALSPEDLLVHQCVHATHGHYFVNGLLFLCDLAAILEHPGAAIDWDVLSRTTRQWRVEKSVYLMLSTARTWLHAAVPDQVLQQWEPPAADAPIIALARTRLLGSGKVPAQNVADLWQVRGLRAKIIVLCRRLFPSRAEMATFYGLPPSSKKLYWCYLLRVRTLYARYGRMVWQLARHDPRLTRLVAEHNTVMTWLRS